MTRLNKIAGAIIAYVLLTSAVAGLPPDVMAFLDTQAGNAKCRPTPTGGETRDQLVKESQELLASKACAPQEAERRALAERYKGNRDVVRSLTPKIGFFNVYRAPVRKSGSE